MKILDLIAPNTKRDIFTRRQELVKQEGSPLYNYSMPATAAGASVAFDLEHQFSLARKYFPLDCVEIVNMESANNLTIIVNGTDSYVVPASSIRTIKNQAFWHIRITNDGAVITTLGNVILTFQRQALDADQKARIT